MRITIRLWGEGECVLPVHYNHIVQVVQKVACLNSLYIPNLAVYWNSSDMNELGDISLGGIPLKYPKGGVSYG